MVESCHGKRFPPQTAAQADSQCNGGRSSAPSQGLSKSWMREMWSVYRSFLQALPREFESTEGHTAVSVFELCEQEDQAKNKLLGQWRSQKTRKILTENLTRSYRK